MFTGRVTRNYFFASILLFSLLLWFAVAFPIRHATNYSWGALLASLPVVVVAYSAWAYHFLFRSNLPPKVYIVEALIGIACFTPFTIHPDLLLAAGNLATSEQNLSTYINSTFAMMVLLISALWAYLNASRHVPEIGGGGAAEACWLTLDLDLDEHAYLSPPGMKRLYPLCVAFSVLGIALLWPSLLTLDEMNSDAQKTLLMRMACMAITIIMYTLLGASLAEVLCLIKIERQQNNGPLRIYDFDERLKWRHDYVKYHLPAPIRMLNLHLFNQHVEAYEQYLSTHKPKRKYRLPSR